MASWVRKKLSVSSPRPSFDELIALVRRYVIQETIGPLRALAKGIAVSLGGAVVFGIGGVLCLLGLLRVLQGETGGTFGGNWSFAPYLITAVGGIGVIGLAALVTLRVLGADRTRSS